MFARPGLRIVYALLFVIVVLIVTWLVVGTENDDGLVTQTIPRDAAPTKAMKPMASDKRQREIPLPDALPYDAVLEDNLVDEAIGVEPSADMPPEPMVIPNGKTPEPIVGPGVADGD